MNEGGNPDLNTKWQYTASSIQTIHNYLMFTESTNLTATPIKFAPPPFTPPTNKTIQLISGFEPAAAGDYLAPQTFDGWTVQTTNPVTVVDDAATAHTGTKYLSLRAGEILRPLPTTMGRNYRVDFAFRAAPSLDGIVSWWPGESVGTDIVDGNHGTLAGNTSYGAGRVGNSFVFDGNRDGVNVGSGPNLQLQDFSIEAWIRRASVVRASFNGNFNGTIFAGGGAGGGYGFWIDQRTGTYNRLMLGKSQVNEVWSAAQIADTNWHHVAVTKKGTTVVFYVDGVAYPAPPYNSGGFVFAVPSYIGAWFNPFGQVDNSFYGAIDELAVYNRELSAAEVQAIYAAGAAGKCGMATPPAVCTSGPSAPAFDVALGFSTNSNPNGVWTYGYSTALGGQMVPHAERGIWGPLQFWRTDIWLGCPTVNFNPSGVTVTNPTGTIVLGPHQLSFHPGPNGEFCIIRFTAPTNGEYRVSGVFTGVDIAGTTTDVHILTNGVLTFNGLINGYGGSTTLPFDFKTALAAGQSVDFAVGRGANAEFTSDSTGLSASVGTVEAASASTIAYIPGVITNSFSGTDVWQTNSLFFTASGTSTLLGASPVSGDSGTWLDTFVLTEFPGPMYVLPEESLKALADEYAYGTWTLEILDTRTGGTNTVPSELISWQMRFVYQTDIPIPASLIPGEPKTNTIPAGYIAYYIVDVPSWATFATNSLLTATAPVNVWFNQYTPPFGTNAGDYLLLNQATGGTTVLSGSTTPPLQPGRRYYLGIQNTNATAVTYAFQVDFDITALADAVPVIGLIEPDSVPRYFSYDVSSNATAVRFALTDLSGNVQLVARQGSPPPTLASYDYGSFNGGSVDEEIMVLTNSVPVALSPGRWYLGVFNVDVGTVLYTIVAEEFALTAPIITLTNGIPYFGTAAANGLDYYRYVVTPNGVRAQFEINGPSGDVTLVARRGWPPPDPVSFDYRSANPGTNDEWILVLDTSAPVPLAAGDWYLTAANLMGTSTSYAIQATEWPVTGQPIAVTGVSVTGTNFCLTWTSLPGAHYFVQGLTDLDNTTWVTVSPTLTATDVLTTWCLPLPSPYHFFRVVEGVVVAP
jgi:hypothetical protein